MSDLDDSWAEALSCALVGRVPAGPLPPGFPESEGRGAEDEILYRVAALGTYCLAGSVSSAEGFVALPEAKGGSDGCPMAAASSLAGVLRDASDFPLARQWVEMARGRGVTVPPELAGRLAEAYAAHSVPLPEDAFGPWLDWRRSARSTRVEEDVSALSGAALSGRLSDWRARDPAAARAAVEGMFAEENAQGRTRLVEALSTGLGPDDEAFLDDRLKDRSVEVRRAAAALLVLVPGSAYSNRLSAAAKAAVSFGAGGRGLEVAPPEWDGLLGEDWLAGQSRFLRGDFRLRAAVAAAPLWTWEGGPDAWISAAGASRWKHELVGAWACAALRERDATWALALLSDASGERLDMRSPHLEVACLSLGALTAGTWESSAAGILRDLDLTCAMRVLGTSSHGTWSDGFTGLVLDALPSLFDAHYRRGRWPESVPLSPVALNGSPTRAAQAAAIADALLPDDYESLRERGRSLATTLERRRVIMESFAA